MKKILFITITLLFAITAMAQSTYTVNFEPGGVGAGWTWVVTENGTNPPLEFVANPVMGGINTSATVAKFTAKAGGNPWALTFTDDNGEFTFDATNKIVKIMVYKSRISNVGVKFEGATGAIELLVPNTLINQWQELTFDFTGSIGKKYNRLVVIPDFLARTTDQIVYFDNIQVPDGLITGPLPEPTTVPPAPTHSQANVISIYSESYTNLAGTNFNPNWGQSTTVTVDYMVAGNKTLRYQNLNYQGTQFTNQNVSLFDYFHLDFWTPNATSLQFFLISANPTSEKAYTLTITPETWVSVDIPLSFFTPTVNLSNVFQFKVVGNGTVYFDNWYFWKNPTGWAANATLSDLKVDGTTVPGFAPNVLSYNVALPYGTTVVPVVTATTTNPAATHVVNATPVLPGITSVVVTSQDQSTTLTYNVNFTIMSPEPSTVPPVPTHAAENVISIYSDAYTNAAGTNFNPFWGQQTIVTLDYMVAGNKTLRYQNLNYQGTEIVNLNVSEYEYFHLDFWTANSTSLFFFLISPGSPAVEQEFALTITPQTWVSVDIPLDAFSPPVNLANVFQFKVEGNGDVWFDNWYFWKSPSGPGSDATLSDLKVSGTTVPGFSPAILSYSMVLPSGTTQVPVVTATTTDPLATHVVNNATSLPGTTAVVVTSANGTVNKTYSINFTVAGMVPQSDYCETEVWHFGNPAEVASAIYLTINNSGPNSMLVEIESATADPVDLLIVVGGSGATISEENTSIPGKISRTLTWAGTPPENVILNILWSKLSFPGNWQLSQANIEVPFAAVCVVVEPKPYLAVDVQDNFENNGYATVAGWKFQDANTPVNLTISADPLNPSNNVANYNRSGNFLYTNASVVLDHRMNLTSRRRFQMKVFFPSSNNYQGDLTPTAAIKLQNSLLGANAWTTQTEIILPVTQFNQWVTLSFNFITAKDSVNYDQIVIQLGGENHNVPAQFYFDDFRLLAPQTGIEANFSAAPVSGYAPLTVQFTDLSTGSPNTWSWDFNGDGVIDSQLKNPTYTYQAPGNYTVYLRAQIPPFLSDQITKYHYISVSELILPDYIYTDFDDNVNVQLSGWPNNPVAVANPNPSGINTSATVGSWQRTGEMWANIYTLLDNTLNFSGSSVFMLKAHAPIACQVVFKLENSMNPALFMERSAQITNPNQWQQLIFDFAGAQSDVYDRMTIFFDFNSTNDNLFYFDELMGPPPTGIALYKPLLAVDVQDNFEDDGYATINEWFFQDPGLIPLVVVADPVNAANHVAQYNRSGTFEYANAQFILDHRMNLSERNQFEMKVYFPSSNNYTGALLPKIELKLQNSLLGPNAWTTQSVASHIVNDFDQWLTLVFDFGFVSDRTDYDQVVVQFGGEGHLVPGLFYFDDFRLLDAAPLLQQVVSLQSGWSGISSWVAPDNTSVAEIFAPVEDDLIILYNNEGIYYPSQGTNTLENWDAQSGYIVKMAQPAEVTFTGSAAASANYSLGQGWSIIPVTSSCNVDVAALFGSLSQVVMVKEVAGLGVYWPQNAISTLNTLMPGKAYYIYSSAPVSFTFPACNP